MLYKLEQTNKIDLSKAELCMVVVTEDERSLKCKNNLLSIAVSLNTQNCETTQIDNKKGTNWVNKNLELNCQI